MVNYACTFGQSESGKYFEWIISCVNRGLIVGTTIWKGFLSPAVWRSGVLKKSKILFEQVQLLVTQHLSGSNIASESAGVVSPESWFSLLQVSRKIHLLCLQFVHPYLLIRDLIMLLKEVTPFFLYVTWLGIPHQWSRGADHLVSCPKEGYRKTTVSSKLLVSVKLILITTSALQRTC